jgi:hypothetical protein
MPRFTTHSQSRLANLAAPYLFGTKKVVDIVRLSTAKHIFALFDKLVELI